jgi:enolase
MALIHNIFARWILDSRGIPTVQCTVTLDQNGRKVIGTASVPSGASTGSHEALELRDGAKDFHGKGVSFAIRNINEALASKLVGREFTVASEVDELILTIDTTGNKSELGANAILAISMASHRAFASLAGLELWQYLRRIYFSYLPAQTRFPRLMCNIINGGAHADNDLTIQEFMIVPNSGEIEKDIQIASEIYQTLKTDLQESGYSVALGDEGGFAPKLDIQAIVNSQPENPNPELNPTKVVLNTIQETITKSGYNTKTDLAMDMAATEFFNKEEEIYTLDGVNMSRSELADFYVELANQYPIISMEDGFAEDDILGWEVMTAALSGKIKLIGDDLFVTNIERFQTIGLEQKIANGVLIKLNQIGTVLETCKMINLAKENNYVTAISHRSGETIDTFISDLSVASQSEFIKLGAPARGERVAKYNRLLEIKDSLV